MATLVKLVPLILVLLVINACRAEDLDAKLNANKDKLTNAINNKCKTKAISSDDVLKIYSGCIDPMVKDSHLFPEKVYPKKFNEIKQLCIMKQSVPNVCEPEAINKFKSCAMVKAMPMVADMKKLMKDKKPELVALLDKMVNTCLVQFEAL